MAASRFPMDAAMLTRNAAKAQQDYVVDPAGRFGPGLWTYVLLVVVFGGLAIFLLLQR